VILRDRKEGRGLHPRTGSSSPNFVVARGGGKESWLTDGTRGAGRFARRLNEGRGGGGQCM